MGLRLPMTLLGISVIIFMAMSTILISLGSSLNTWMSQIPDKTHGPFYEACEGIDCTWGKAKLDVDQGCICPPNLFHWVN